MARARRRYECGGRKRALAWAAAVEVLLSSGVGVGG